MGPNEKRLPVWGSKICKQMLPPEVRAGALQDFELTYLEISEDKGRISANTWFYMQIIQLMPTFLFERVMRSISMFKNYLKIAFRNIKKHKSFSFINIIGLALSMSLCLFIIKFILFIYSFDGFHEDSDRIFLITSERLTKSSGRFSRWDTTPFPLASVIKNECPDVESIALLSHSNIDQISYNNKTFKAKTVFAGEDFFDIISVNFKYGEPSQFNSQPNSIIITDKVSEKFFRDQDPVGTVVHCGQMGDMVVSGVIYEIPHNSKLHDFEILVSYDVLESYWQSNPDNRLDSWTSLGNPYQTVICKIEENSSRESVDRFLEQTIAKYIVSDEYTLSFSLLPFQQYVYQNNFIGNSFGIEFPSYMIYTMVFCALSILIIACFNYANLSAAKSLTRLREVGMRKVIGARRSQLFIQFIMESVVLSLFAFIAALYLQKVITDLYLRMHPEVSLMFKFEGSFSLYLLFLIFTVLTGIFSGLLPALYFSRPRPIDIFTKLDGYKLFSGTAVRKILIAIQFSFSYVFIIMTISANNQFKYAEQFDLGINTDNIININMPAAQMPIYKNAISGSEFIQEISASSSMPGIQFAPSCYIRNSDSPDSIRVRYIAVDNSFIKNMGLEIVYGNNHPKSVNSENEKFILINETASETFGFQNPIDAVNQGVMIGDQMVNIIGVVKDFTYGQYQNSIRPLALRFLPEKLKYLNIKLSDTNRDEAVASLEKKWGELYPNELFIYQFYDEGIEERNLFSRIMMLMGLFVTVIAIIIASMGLLGISMYTVQTRIKEISIRKVLGANVRNLLRILSKEFVFLIGVSSIIAIPISVYLNDLTMQSIDNKADLGIGDISFSVILMFSLGFATIMIQIIKAIHINPADSLRNE